MGFQPGSLGFQKAKDGSGNGKKGAGLCICVEKVSVASVCMRSFDKNAAAPSYSHQKEFGKKDKEATAILS